MLLKTIQDQLPQATQSQLDKALLKMDKTEEQVKGNNSYIFEAITHIKNQGGLAVSKSTLVTQVQSQIKTLEAKPNNKKNKSALANLKIQLQELEVLNVDEIDTHHTKAVNQIDSGLTSFIQTLERSNQDADEVMSQSIQDYAKGASEVAYTALEAHNKKVESINRFAENANENLNRLNQKVIDDINSKLEFQTNETGDEMLSRLGIDLSVFDLVKS